MAFTTDAAFERYYDETVAGFDKNPTIAQGRFLATVNPKCCLSAVLIETRKNE